MRFYMHFLGPCAMIVRYADINATDKSMPTQMLFYMAPCAPQRLLKHGLSDVRGPHT